MKNIVLALGFMLVLVAMRKSSRGEKVVGVRYSIVFSSVMCGQETRVPAARDPTGSDACMA